MATVPSQSSSVSSKPPSSDATGPRWSKPGERGPASNAPNRPARGRSGRVRGGPRNNKTREDKATPNEGALVQAPADKPEKPAPAAKPALLITPPSVSSVTSNTPKNSRRPSRTNSSANLPQTSPVVQSPVTPLSARSSNRRKRSGAGRGNNTSQKSKANVPLTPEEESHSARPKTISIPQNAPPKDTPPHLSNKLSHTSHSPFDVRQDIDALVERVRAVAMAENRPSTPGSHIDWAGDDDDSLPDLDDWGIPSLSERKAQTISPIIVDGLKHLPEPSPHGSGNITEIPPSQASVQNAVKQADVQNTSSPPAANEKGPQRTHLHPSLPPKPQLTSNVRIVNEFHKPMASRRSRLAEDPIAASVAAPTTPQSASDVNSATNTQDNLANVQPQPTDLFATERSHAVKNTPQRPPQTPNAQSDLEELSSGTIPQSIHALSTKERTEAEPEEGLSASIHAPRSLADSNSAPSELGGYLPKNHYTHARAQTTGRPFHRPNYSDSPFNRSPYPSRGMPHGSPRQHMRNHSSPSVATSNRSSHSRPVLTGDAISRLVKTIGGATTPPTKTMPIAND